MTSLQDALPTTEKTRFKQAVQCTTCLNPGHSALECTLRMHCLICHSRAHTLELCEYNLLNKNTVTIRQIELQATQPQTNTRPAPRDSDRPRPRDRYWDDNRDSEDNYYRDDDYRRDDDYCRDYDYRRGDDYCRGNNYRWNDNYRHDNDYRRAADYHRDDEYIRDDRRGSRYETEQGHHYDNQGSANIRGGQAKSRQYDRRPQDFRQREEHPDNNRRGPPNNHQRVDRHLPWHTREN